MNWPLRNQLARVAAALAVAIVGVGCQSSEVEGLKGRWTGTISCSVGVAAVTMGLQVQGYEILGDAITRSNDINSDWKLEGSQQSLHRTTSCRDDSCDTDDDCAGKGGGSCNIHGICEPCEQEEEWRQVTLHLIDSDVQSPDPKMVLERFGDERLVGEIEKFCPDENLASVAMDKEKN